MMKQLMTAATVAAMLVCLGAGTAEASDPTSVGIIAQLPGGTQLLASAGKGTKGVTGGARLTGKNPENNYVYTYNFVITSGSISKTQVTLKGNYSGGGATNIPITIVANPATGAVSFTAQTGGKSNTTNGKGSVTVK